MKNIYLLLVFVFILGCSKDDESKPASLEIKVSYYYNNFFGYKADIGADAFLFKQSQVGNVCTDSINVVNARFGILVDENGDDILGSDGESLVAVYEKEAGVDGLIRFSDVEPGKYFLMVSSKGRWTFSCKEIQLHSGEDMSLVKNFGYILEYLDGGEPW